MSRTKLPRRMVVAPVTTRRRNIDTRRRVAVTGIHDPTHHTDQGHMVRCELDSHADTCVLGSNFKLIELTGEVVNVVPYHEEYDVKKDVPNLFTNGKYMRVYPTAGKSSREFADLLTDFTDDVGIPDTVFCDLAPEYVGPRTPFMREVRRLKIRMRNPRKDEQRSKTIKLKLRLES